MMRMMTVVMREVAESNKLNRQLAKDNTMLREELSELRSQSGRLYASMLKSGSSARTSKSVTWATPSEGSAASIDSRMSRFTYSRANIVELALDITAFDATATFEDVPRIRERIMAIFKSTEALKDIEITGLRVFQVDGKLGIVKFSIPKDNEVVLRQTSDVWLESFMPRAKL